MRASVRVAAAVLVVIAVMLWAIPSSPVVAQAKKMRVGLVFDVGGRGDKSFNDMAYDGLAARKRRSPRPSRRVTSSPRRAGRTVRSSCACWLERSTT